MEPTFLTTTYEARTFTYFGEYHPDAIVWLFCDERQSSDREHTSPAEVVVGQTFQVRYTVLDAKAIDTVRFIGQYTPALLSLSTMSPSGQLDSKSPSTAFNQVNGTFSYGAFTIAGAMDGSVGAGAFTFKALEKVSQPFS